MKEISPAKSVRNTCDAVNSTEPLPRGDPRCVGSAEARGNEDVVSGTAETALWSPTPVYHLFDAGLS
jgi:hypothetical protein